MYSNWKIKKSDLDKKTNEYAEVASWCNENQGYTIIEDGNYYKVVANEISLGDVKNAVRAVRNQYLAELDFTQLTDAPFTAEEKTLYTRYRKYLRDYTTQDEWWLENPKTFDEWSAE